MNKEFFEVLKDLQTEKGIDSQFLIERISSAISLAIKKDNQGSDDSIVVIDPEKKLFYAAMRKTVVDEITNPRSEILLDEAKRYNINAIVGDIVEIPLDTQHFGRITAKSAKEVIRQGIRSAEKEIIFKEFINKEHDIVSGTVVRIDPLRGGITVNLGKMEVVLPKSEQIPNDTYKEGDVIRLFIVEVADTERGPHLVVSRTHPGLVKRLFELEVPEIFNGTVEGDVIRLFIVEVADTERGPHLVVSRTHPGLVKRLFELEVPEIFNGTVEIVSVAREAGSRTKMAVSTSHADVDARGACIGMKGSRVSSVVDELCGEKIDVVLYSEDPEKYIAEALSPADVTAVNVIDAELKTCVVEVPEAQLSLAIGNKGQNARLAAKLTGWKIDIRANSN